MNASLVNSQGYREAPDMGVTSESFRHVMQHFSKSVTVITTRKDQLLWGMTATAVCGVSQNPPIVLACVSTHSRMHAFIRDSGIFAVNLLRCGQEDLAECFAGRLREGADRFSGVDFRTVVTGAPVLNDCLVFADCRIVNCWACGDHSVFAGYVEAVGQLRVGGPLVRHLGAYMSFAKVE